MDNEVFVAAEAKSIGLKWFQPCKNQIEHHMYCYWLNFFKFPGRQTTQGLYWWELLVCNLRYKINVLLNIAIY